MSSVATDPSVTQPSIGPARGAGPVGTSSTAISSPFGELLSARSAPFASAPPKPPDPTPTAATVQSSAPAPAADPGQGPVAAGRPAPLPPQLPPSTHAPDGSSNSAPSHATISPRAAVAALSDQATAGGDQPPTTSPERPHAVSSPRATASHKTDKAEVQTVDTASIALLTIASAPSPAAQAPGTHVIVALGIPATMAPSGDAPVEGSGSTPIAPPPPSPSPDIPSVSGGPAGSDHDGSAGSGSTPDPMAAQSLAQSESSNTAAPLNPPPPSPKPAPVSSNAPGVGSPIDPNATAQAPTAPTSLASAAASRDGALVASAGGDLTAASAGPSGDAGALRHEIDPAQTAAPPILVNPPPASGPPLAAAAPASAAEAAPAEVPISGLAVEIAVRATRDEKSFQIRLDPPELGRIDVQLNVDTSGRVTTHLTADRTDTLDLLRQDASSLQRALESAGLKTGGGGLEFSLRNQSFAGNGGGHPNSATTPSTRIVVLDEELPAVQTIARGYGQLRGLGAGVDIRV